MSEAFEQITVLMFALPRDLVGSDQVEVNLSQPFTAADLKLALAQQYPVLAACLAGCRIVADQRYLADHQVVPADVEVALIPPVSGG